MYKYLKEFNNKYYVTDDGNVFNDETGRMLKPVKINKTGDFSVWFLVGRCRFLRSIKKLVADAFVENPEEFKYVSHKDGDRSNNSASNLIWVPHYREKRVVCEESGEVYRSIKEAAESEFISSVHLATCIRKGKAACGKHFKII